MRFRAASASVVAILAGCFEPVPPAAPGCTDCHGGMSGSAPPEALGGFTALEHTGVGAHAAHLSRRVECSECHVVPATVDAPGHIDTPWPAEVKWGQLSKTGSVTGVWNRASRTCANVYCHGATLGGGLHKVPIWTKIDGTQVGCGSCHGAPPPPPHPAASTCEDCHPGAGAETHVDGTVQVHDSQMCRGCHGGADSLAPPPDTMGRISTNERTVGAHQTHLTGGVFSKPLPCTSCHSVPAATDAPGHIDTPPAEVSLSSGTWDPVNLTCSNTYCHATSSSGATTPAPAWTAVPGVAAPCGACHGLPPPEDHPNSSRCEDCHGSVAGPNLTIANPVRHADGQTQF